MHYSFTLACLSALLCIWDYVRMYVKCLMKEFRLYCIWHRATVSA